MQEPGAHLDSIATGCALNGAPAFGAVPVCVMVELHAPDASTAEAKIELNLSRLAQLFNSLDPAPFQERDLDQDAEDYILSSAEEIAQQRPLRLVVHLPADQVPQRSAQDLGEAIHNYFAYRAALESRRMRILFRDGRIALIIGFLFLLGCTLLRELVYSFGHESIADLLGEGLLIIGWVAMWRPLEIFLYEWVPIRRRCRVLAKLSKIPVVIQPRSA